MSKRPNGCTVGQASTMVCGVVTKLLLECCGLGLYILKYMGIEEGPLQAKGLHRSTAAQKGVAAVPWIRLHQQLQRNA
jgi:hypothetical protein